MKVQIKYLVALSCSQLGFVLISFFSESAEADHLQIFTIEIFRRVVDELHLLVCLGSLMIPYLIAC